MAIENIFIESQIVVQTAAQWAADTTVYSAKRILVTSDQTFTGTDFRKFKLADGVQTWSGLDYLPIDTIIAGLASLQSQINNTGLTEVLLVNNETGGTPIIITLSDLIKSANASGTTIDFGMAGNEFYVTIDGGTGNNGYYSLLNNDVEFGIASDKLISLVTSQLLLTHATKITLNSPLINLPNLTASRFLSTDGSKNAATTKEIPSGVVLGDTDAQTLTNKTISLANNTVSGSAAQFNAACSDNDFAYVDNTKFTGVILRVGHASTNYADGTTYRYGINMAASAVTSQQLRAGATAFIDGTVVACRLNLNYAAGSNEPVTIKIRNNTTGVEITVTSALDFSASAANAGFYFSGLSLTVNDGDEIEGQIVTPTWSTNPTVVTLAMEIYIKAT